MPIFANPAQTQTVFELCQRMLTTATTPSPQASAKKIFLLAFLPPPHITQYRQVARHRTLNPVYDMPALQILFGPMLHLRFRDEPS